MDNQVALWEQQAAEALRRSPDKQDQILAKLDELKRGKITEWHEQATRAVDRAPDKQKDIEAKFRDLVSSSGYQLNDDADLQLSAFRPGKVEAGSTSTADEAFVPGFGETEAEFYDRKERESKNVTSDKELLRRQRASMTDAEKLSTDLRGIGKAAIGGFGQFAGGAVGIGAGTLAAAASAPQEVTDAMFSASDWLKQKGSEIAASEPLASRNAQYGAFLPALAGGFAVDPFNRGAEIVQAGGDLTDAELAAAQGGAVNVASVGAGALGSQLRGLPAMASRAALQVPASLAIGYADRELRGEETTRRNIAEDTALGLFGSVFRNPSKVERTAPTPKTGDAATDAGIDLVDTIAESTVTRAPEQGDLFSPQNELSMDMFSKETVPASLMEQRRQRQALANKGEEAQRTPSEDLQLERDYLIDQQNKLNDRQLLSQPEPPAQADLANFGIPEVSREPTQSSIRTDAEGNPVGYSESGVPNTAIRDALRTAGERRTTGLQNQDMFSGPVKESTLGPDAGQETFTPSRNETVDQRPIQETMELPAQQDLFGTGQETPKPVRTQAEAQKELGDATTIQEAVAALENGGVPLFADSNGTSFRATPVPEAMLAKRREGKLTTEDILNESSRVLPTDTKAAQEAGNLVRYIRSVAERIGGLKTRHVDIDLNNPEHAAVLERNKDHIRDGTVAFFDPNTNAIYYRHAGGPQRTAIHEAVHGITSQLLSLGERGNLRGPALKAYQEMAALFNNIVKPELKSRAAKVADVDKRHLLAYGLSDKNGTMHEFMSEFFSNGVFRNSLKEMKLDSSKLAPIEQGFLGRVKNVYDLVVKGVSRMMASAGLRSVVDIGGAKKAETAFEAMFGQMDRLFNWVDDATASALRENSMRNTEQAPADMSFLGEQVPRRGISAMEAPQESQLQKPRNKFTTMLKAGLASKGIEPKVTDARNLRSGEQSAGVYKAITVQNRLMDAIGKDPVEQVKLGDAISGKTDPKAYLASIKDPIYAGAVRDFLNSRAENALALYRTVMSNPNATAAEKAWAGTVVKNANTFVHRAYEMHLDPPKRGMFKWMTGGYMGRKMKLANEAEAKLGTKSYAPLTDTEKAQLTPDQANSLEQLRGMRRYVGGWFNNDTSALRKLSLEDIGDRYRAVRNLDPDEITRDLPTSEKKDALISAYLEQLNKTKLPDLIDNMIVGLSGLSPEKTGALASYVRNMRLGADVMTQIDNVPPVVRKWWGEIKNPIVQIVQTMATQSSNLAQLKANKHLRDSGMGTLFSETVTKTHSEPIKGEKMGALNGLFTTPDIMKALDGFTEINQSVGDIISATVANPESNALSSMVWSELAAGARQLSKAKKLATVVFNQGRWEANALGSAGQLVTNGNMSPTAISRGINAALATLDSSSRRKLNPDVELLYKYMQHEPTQTDDLRHGVGSKELIAVLRKAAGHKDPLGFIKKTFGKAFSLSKEGYALTDLWTKFANFFNDVEQWKAHNEKLGKKMSDDELYRFVADRNNDVNITPSRAPEWARAIERHGGTQYFPYQIETFRTTINNLIMGAKDAKEGINTGDTKFALYGMRRMIGAGPGMFYSQLFYHKGVLATLGALGYAATSLQDDDKRRDFLNLDDSKLGSEISVIKDSKGNEYVMDAGQFPPMDPAIRPMTSLLQAIGAVGKGDTEEANKKLVEATNQMANLVSRNSMYRDLSKVISGNEPTVAKGDPRTYEKWAKNLQDIGLDKAAYDRMLNAVNIVMPKGAMEYLRGSNEETDPEIKSLIKSGLGVRKLDPAAELSSTKYFGQSRKREIKDAKDKYLDMLKQGFDADPKKVEDKFVEAIKEAAKPYSELQIAVDAARAQGVSRKKLISNLDNLGLGDALTGGLLRGRPLDTAAMLADLEKDLDNKLLADMDNPERKAEVMRRYKENTNLMLKLYKKYRSVAIEDLP